MPTGSLQTPGATSILSEMWSAAVAVCMCWPFRLGWPQENEFGHQRSKFHRFAGSSHSGETRVGAIVHSSSDDPRTPGEGTRWLISVGHGPVGEGKVASRGEGHLVQINVVSSRLRIAWVLIQHHVRIVSYCTLGSVRTMRFAQLAKRSRRALSPATRSRPLVGVGP